MIFTGFTDVNGNVIPVQGAGTVYDEQKNSLALGKDTVAIGQDQLVFGRKNIQDANKVEIVGGGGLSSVLCKDVYAQSISNSSGGIGTSFYLTYLGHKESLITHIKTQGEEVPEIIKCPDNMVFFYVKSKRNPSSFGTQIYFGFVEDPAKGGSIVYAITNRVTQGNTQLEWTFGSTEKKLIGVAYYKVGTVIPLEDGLEHAIGFDNGDFLYPKSATKVNSLVDGPLKVIADNLEDFNHAQGTSYTDPLGVSETAIAYCQIQTNLSTIKDVVIYSDSSNYVRLKTMIRVSNSYIDYKIDSLEVLSSFVWEDDVEVIESANIRTLDWNGNQWNAGDITCDDGNGNTISMRDLLSRIATLEAAAES